MAQWDMADTVSPEVRSRIMASIRGRNTKPELTVRKGLHALGFRYSLHSSRFPGRPDIVLAKHNAVVFIHGCYWHGHRCGAAKLPSSNESYWHPKIERTRMRDAKNASAVESAGWRSLTIWECALRGKSALGPERVIEMAAQWIMAGTSSSEIAGDSLPESF